MRPPPRLHAAALAAALLASGCHERTVDDCFQRLDPAACRSLCHEGEITMGRGTACLIWGNYDKASEHAAFTEGCRQDNTGACNRLAAIEPDPAKRKAALTAACNAFDRLYAERCVELADLEPDPAARKRALEAGCRGGDDRACDRYAPIETDRTRLREVFEEGCSRKYLAPCPRVIDLDREKQAK